MSRFIEASIREADRMERIRRQKEERRRRWQQEKEARKLAQRIENERRWAEERQRREEEYKDRVRSKTEEFLSRYEQQYDRMISQGYDSYIPSEMNDLWDRISQAKNELDFDPVAARDLSFEIGTTIRDVQNRGYIARQHYYDEQKAERERRKQEKQEAIERQKEEDFRQQQLEIEKIKHKEKMVQLYYNLLSAIADPIVAHFTLDEMRELQQNIENGVVDNEESIRNTVSKITKEAQIKADKWKEQTQINETKEDIEIQLNEAESRIKSNNSINPAKAAEFAQKIKEIRANLSSNEFEIDSVTSELSHLDDDVDQAMISEDTRREAVVAIVKQLQSQEFTVENPQLIIADGKNYVKIIAKRPSGKRVVCNIDLHGKLAYKFDNYEGMTCIKDIQQFNVGLEEVYSIKLSDERIIWENPDKLSKDSVNRPADNGRFA